jgi:hypothetical protein
MKKQVKNVLIEMPYILIVILIVLQGYSLIRIYSLENQIQNKSNMLQSSINNLDNRIRSIPMNIEESMKQKASMILDTSFEIGAFNILLMRLLFWRSRARLIQVQRALPSQQGLIQRLL